MSKSQDFPHDYLTTDGLYETSHLNCFKDFKKATKILGNIYTPLTKLHYYQMVGLVKKDEVIKIGDYTEDTKIHTLVPMPSGKGKMNYRSTCAEVCKRMALQGYAPSTLHPEQLVGKTILKKQGKEWVLNTYYGYLYDDLLQFDEAHSYLTEKDPMTKEIRDQIKKGVDKPGLNEVYKRLTEQKRENALRYDANAVCQFYFQPIKVDEIIVLDGFMRRFIFPYVEFPRLDRRSQYKNKAKGTGSKEEYLTAFCQHLAGVKNVAPGITFTEAAQERLGDLHIALEDIGFNRSAKAANYTEIVGYELGSGLVKLSSIIALDHYTNKVDVPHLELAFLDYAEFFSLMLDFIDKQVFGNLDYGRGWRGAMGKAKKCLEWLVEQGATSKEKSNVSISDFQDYVSEVFEYKSKGNRQARRKVSNWKEKNQWIDSMQLGGNETKVWIAFEPMLEEGGQGGQGGLRVYEKISAKYGEILEKVRELEGEISPTPCPPVPPLPPSKNSQNLQKCEVCAEKAILVLHNGRWLCNDCKSREPEQLIEFEKETSDA